MLMSINNFTNIHVKVQFLKQNCEDINQPSNPLSRPDQCIPDGKARVWGSLSVLLHVALVLYILFFFNIFIYRYIQDIFIDIYTDSLE